MKDTPLDLTLFSKAHFAMGDPELASQEPNPTPFFFHAAAASSSSFQPPQDVPKEEVTSLYHPTESSSSTSTSEYTTPPTYHPYDDPFMSMFVDPTSSNNDEPECESSQTPINANRRRSTKGKATRKDPSSDPESDSDPFAILKRRRNTEASARFRVKKKMREQVLRRTADETTLRSQQLQHRVNELEKEIKWLRELIVEKKKKEDHH